MEQFGGEVLGIGRQSIIPLRPHDLIYRAGERGKEGLTAGSQRLQAEWGDTEEGSRIRDGEGATEGPVQSP